MKYCCFCGSKLNWNGQHNLSDYDCDNDCDGVVSIYSCSCGANFEALTSFEDDDISSTKNIKQILCNWID